jgi:hypothetical protein
MHDTCTYTLLSRSVLSSTPALPSVGVGGASDADAAAPPPLLRSTHARREVVLLAVAALAASRLGGVSAAWTLAAAAAAVAAACAALALQRVEFIGGHRAGAKGYSGAR